MQKIEVIVRITKGHCPPQEQTIFEWIEMNRAAPDTLNYPGLEINLEHRRVFKNGQEVYMSRYEYGVLSLMARHPGQLFTKEQIFEAVWHQDSESCLTAVTNTIGRILFSIFNIGDILHRNITFQCQLLLCHFHRFSDSLYMLPQSDCIRIRHHHHLNSIVSFLRKERYNIIVPAILSYCADFAFPGRVIKKR